MGIEAAIIGSAVIGAAGSAFGSSGSQTVTNQTVMSPEQIELIKKQVELADIQIGELGRQRELQGQVFDPATAGAGRIEQSIGQTPFDFSQIPTSQPGAIPGANILPAAQLPGAAPSPGRQIATGGTSDQLASLQLQRIQAGGQATPQETSLINDAVSRARAAGETDIKRFQSQSTEQLREELAPQLGLRSGDTPILDRGGRIAAEAVRQQGQLVNNLEGQRAESLLNFPLQRASTIGGLTAQQQGLGEQALQFDTGLTEQQRQFGGGFAEQQRQFGTAVGEGQRQFDVGASEQQRQFQEQLSQSIRGFQSQLQQSAFANRLQLAGARSTAGLGLAGVSTPNIGPAFASTGSTQSSSSGAGFGEITGGVGGLLGGLGLILGP